MKKTIVIFVFGFPSRLPKKWLESFRELEEELSKTKTACDQKVEFCFVNSFFLNDSISFSSQGDRNSISGKGVNLFLKNKLIQNMIVAKLVELGKKSEDVKFRAGSGFFDLSLNAREEFTKTSQS